MKKAYNSPKISSFNIADSLNVYSVSGYCSTPSFPGDPVQVLSCTDSCTSTCSNNKTSGACGAPCSGTIQQPASC